MLKASLILLGVVFIFQARAARMVQAPYNDTLCARYNSDGTVCLECAYRSFYDNSTGVCTNVDGSCKTWDNFNGECLTCYDGFGSGLINGNAVNGTCPLYDTNASNPHCQCYMNGNTSDTCISCAQSFYLDLNDICQTGIIGCIDHSVGNQTSNVSAPSLTCL